MLFRGIIQNLLEKEIGRPGLALGVAAVIFGAAHLNNGPHPDWRYFLLATLAGVVYGRAYARTRNLMAPALVHTLVDVAWRGFFPLMRGGCFPQDTGPRVHRPRSWVSVCILKGCSLTYGKVPGSEARRPALCSPSRRQAD